jgi:hypothetical protein
MGLELGEMLVSLPLNPDMKLLGLDEHKLELMVRALELALLLVARMFPLVLRRLNQLLLLLKLLMLVLLNLLLRL